MERFNEDRQDGCQGQTSVSTDAVDHSSLDADKCYEYFLTHGDDVKLNETPIVYTTKLDDMNTFNRISSDLDFNFDDITNRILCESKPSMKNPFIHNSHTNQTSYDRVAKKIKEINEKSRHRNVNSNDRNILLAQEDQIENETNNLSVQLHKSINYECSHVNSQSKNMDSTTTTGIVQLINEIPEIDHPKINSETVNNSSSLVIEIKSDEDDDIMLLNYDTTKAKTSTLDVETRSIKKTNKRKKNKINKTHRNTKCNTIITVDTSDSDEEQPLAIIKYKKQKLNNLEQYKQLRIVLEDIGIRRRKLREKPFKGPGFIHCGKWYQINKLSSALKIRNVYLFFHDKCTQTIDIYIIENGEMKEHRKLNFKKSSVILKNSFNLQETIEIECYCWYERMQASLKALESGILSTYDVMLMKQPHNCEQRTCVCCCSTQNNTGKNSNTIGDFNISEEDLEIKQMEEEISQKISAIQKKDLCYSVLKHFDWNHILHMENSYPTLINECLAYKRIMEGENVYPKYLNTKSVKLKLSKNPKFINNWYKSITLLQPKSVCVANYQNSSSTIEDQNTKPHLLSQQACQDTKKNRPLMKFGSLLIPDRSIKRVATLKIERSLRENVPKVRTLTKCIQYSENVTNRPSQNKSISAKRVQPEIHKKEPVRRGQFNDENYKKSLANVQNAEYTETQKVKNVAELIDVLIARSLGVSSQEPCAENPKKIQRNEELVSTDTIHCNPTVSETNDLDVDSLITTILKRFEGIRLTINEDRKVSISLNMPLNTLSLAELKVLASIITQAQQQVDALGLLPGNYLANANLKQNKNTHLLDEIVKHQQLTAHQKTAPQISQTQQKVNEEVLLPEPDLANSSSKDYSPLGQITDSQHSCSNSPIIMDEAISSRHKDINMLNNDASSLCASGINDVDADVYKIFSNIVMKKNDCYKKSFLAVNPYPTKGNSTPMIKISNVYSLAADC